MKYVEEFRNYQITKNLIKKIEEFAKKFEEKVNIMEVCGTHTMAIGKYGIRKFLPKNINLISGPGCPVCVSSESYIDKAIGISDIPDTIIATFGDMMKVPGSFTSLERKMAENGNIEIVYSPFDALNIAEKNKDKNVVFISVGFETTTCGIASAVKIAKEKNLKNFFILAGNKLIPPVMEFLLKEKDANIDAFISPGHVSAIIGEIGYKDICEKYNVLCVITGFEPVDILYSIYLILKNIYEGGKGKVINEYKRTVKTDGNFKAKNMIFEVFDICDTEWRGIGLVENSGLKLNENYSEFDVENQFNIKEIKINRKRGCICGEILKGKKTPFDCPLFEKFCNPENPIGPCMVSSEGTCAAYYKYERG